MGRVDAFSIDGLELWFWSDDHLPPHFHAKKTGDWEIKVRIFETEGRALSYEVKWGRGPSGRLQAEMAKQVVRHREALYEEWEHKTRTEAD